MNPLIFDRDETTFDNGFVVHARTATAKIAAYKKGIKRDPQDAMHFDGTYIKQLTDRELESHLTRLERGLYKLHEIEQWKPQHDLMSPRYIRYGQLCQSKDEAAFEYNLRFNMQQGKLAKKEEAKKARAEKKTKKEEEKKAKATKRIM